MNQQEFLNKYEIKEADFEKTGYCWEELMEIVEDYQSEINEFKKLANYVEGCLIDIEKVHSIKKRIKDPEHLIEKIIRKKIARPEVKITAQNYKEIITDLIGVRVLHLFKEDWTAIHHYIMKKWNLKESPTANVREGDKGEFILKFKELDCDVKIHPYGYRSVHYLILLSHNKSEITAEIQVRTVFEEAWSEIDHIIRYPYDIENPILSEYLVIFNRLAGSADEMGSFIKLLKQDLANRTRELDEKNRIILELQREIESSKLEKEQKERINTSLKKLFTVGSGSKLNHLIDSETLDEATRELEHIFGNLTIADAAREMQHVIENLSEEELYQAMQIAFGKDGMEHVFGRFDSVYEELNEGRHEIKLLGDGSRENQDE